MRGSEPLALRTCIAARVVTVIETRSLRGAGIPGDPVREVTQFWDFDGKLLAERDPETYADVVLAAAGKRGLTWKP